MTTETAGENETEKGARHLTSAEWAEIVVTWELGQTTGEALAARFGITPAGLAKGLKSRGAKKGARAHEVTKKVEAAVVNKTIETTVQSAESVIEERKRQIAETKRFHHEGAAFLSRAALKTVADAIKPGATGLASVQGDLKALRVAMATLAQGQRERLLALDADKLVDAFELPSLTIRDLTEEEITNLKSTQVQDDGDLLDDLLEAEAAGAARKTSASTIVVTAPKPAPAREEELTSEEGGRLVKEANNG